MKFDRNTVIGFVALALLFFGYFYFNRQQQLAYELEKRRTDSIAQAALPKDTLRRETASPAANDSTPVQTNIGGFPLADKGNAQEVIVQNNVFRIGFSTKGGQPSWIELLNYKDHDSGFVKLANSEFDKIAYRVNTGTGNTVETSELLFNQVDSSVDANGNKTYSFAVAVGDSIKTNSIVHSFTVKPDDYMVDMQIKLNGADRLVTDRELNLIWGYHASQQETAIDFEKQNTQVDQFIKT